MDISILQPHIPHYREEFFRGISEEYDTEIYCYNLKDSKKDGFQNASLKINNIWSLSFGRFLLFDPFKLLNTGSPILVLMIDFTHITTWILLLTKFIHKRKIILWGHGISVKHYLKEEKRPRILLKFMLSLSDGIWLYTRKEEQLWKNILPTQKIISLDNTISNVDKILNRIELNVKETRSKYNIKQKLILIYCARFTTPYRRTDLLVELIEKVNSDKIGFIIIGNGSFKPDFQKYTNVYDFGAVYDENLKNELFQISDIYFQPAWIGLSVVEALAYGKPVFTLKRDALIKQCVEYSYLNDNNCILFDNIDSVVKKLGEITDFEIGQMSFVAQKSVSENLQMQNMINNATKFIDAEMKIKNNE